MSYLHDFIIYIIYTLFTLFTHLNATSLWLVFIMHKSDELLL